MTEKINDPCDAVSQCCKDTAERIRKNAPSPPQQGDEITCDGCESMMEWRGDAWHPHSYRAMKSFTCDYNIGGGGETCWVQRGQEFCETSWGNNSLYRYCMPHFKELDAL